jgi:hypothetical protein
MDPRHRRGLRKLRPDCTAHAPLDILPIHSGFLADDGTIPGLPGQGLLQITELFLALVLCALIGVERETRMAGRGLAGLERAYSSSASPFTVPTSCTPAMLLNVATRCETGLFPLTSMVSVTVLAGVIVKSVPSRSARSNASS